jgi:serine protease Do
MIARQEINQIDGTCMMTSNTSVPPGGRLLRTIIVALVVMFPAAISAFAEDLGPNKSDLIRSLLPTVVNVSVQKDEKTPTSAVSVGATTPPTSASPLIKGYVGSGFVIDPSGLIVTNYHVVENAFEITIMFSDGTRLPGKVVSASRLADLALVKVEAGHPLQTAHWGNSDQVQIGDQVFAAGNPFGIGLSISAGIVSGLNRDIQDSPYDDYIQTDATINHGNSGGPLFDMQGNVVGVDSAIISPTTGSAGIGFAIPANGARFVIDQLRTYGWVRPGWIGIKLQLVTPEIAAAMGMKRAEGSIVSWVLPEGPAKQAGLAIGDVILRFDGRVPSDDRALLREIVRTPVGGTITLAVMHDGGERSVTLATREWPRNQWDVRDAPVVTLRPKIAIPHDLGLTLGEVPADRRSALGLVDGLTGVMVKSVLPDSDPVRRGMTGGDIILRVQGTPVATPDDVQSAIDAARTAKRDYLAVLILPKVREPPGPKWVALQLAGEGW